MKRRSYMNASTSTHKTEPRLCEYCEEELPDDWPGPFCSRNCYDRAAYDHAVDTAYHLKYDIEDD